MYCAKCGNELKDNEQFCPNCGTKSGSTGNRLNLNISTNDIENKATEIKANLISGINDLLKNRILILADIALIIISMIFSFTNVFSVTAILGISQGFPMLQGTAIKFVYAILYIIAIAVLIMPLLFKKAWSPKFFLPAKITAVLSFIWFFIALFTAKGKMDSYGLGSMGNLNLSITGWLFVIATLGAVVLSFKNSFDLKKEGTNGTDTNCNNSQTNKEL